MIRQNGSSMVSIPCFGQTEGFSHRALQHNSSAESHPVQVRIRSVIGLAYVIIYVVREVIIGLGRPSDEVCRCERGLDDTIAERRAERREGLANPLRLDLLARREQAKERPGLLRPG
jgi:hypothetical protein